MINAGVQRLQQLHEQIALALGRGEMPELQLAEFRFRWATLPQEVDKENLGFTLRDIEVFVANLRRDRALSQGAGQVKYLPIQAADPFCFDESCCR